MLTLLERAKKFKYGIRVTESSDDKETFFVDRTQSHINSVKACADTLCKAYPDLYPALITAAKTHDESKFSAPEREAYIELTYAKKEGVRPKDPQKIADATLHHILNNKHHPEYWLEDKSKANISAKDRDASDEVVDASNMPELALAEMVCDWQAMSEELKTNTAREWFDKQRDVRWHFSDDQVAMIDKFLKVFEDDTNLKEAVNRYWAKVPFMRDLNEAKEDLSKNNLYQHAVRELKLAGMGDSDSDYGGALNSPVLDIVKVFCEQNHSGGSAACTIGMLEKLLRFENLTPITDNPEDWENINNKGFFKDKFIKDIWQCKRNPALFSNDGGKTYYSVNDKERKLLNSEKYDPNKKVQEGRSIAIKEFIETETVSDIDTIKESSIDFPRPGLCPEVWDKDQKVDAYTLNKECRATINEYLESILDGALMKVAKDVHVVGSICSNLYTETSDIDVHVVPESMPKDKAEKLQELVKKYVKQNKSFHQKHPIEVYVQTEPEQDLFSVGDYDFVTDEWLKEPTIFGLDYNPYDVYADIMDTVQEFAKKSDVNLGELKRDVIDYSVVKDAMGKLPVAVQQDLKKSLEKKLSEINADVEALLKDKKVIVDLRRAVKAKDALKDEEKAKQWSDNNAIFKFMNRYQYMTVISDLESIYDKEQKAAITHDDVSKVKKAVSNV